MNYTDKSVRACRTAHRRNFSGGQEISGPILDMEEGRPLRETLSSFIRVLRGRG